MSRVPLPKAPVMREGRRGASTGLPLASFLTADILETSDERVRVEYRQVGESTIAERAQALRRRAIRAAATEKLNGYDELNGATGKYSLSEISEYNVPCKLTTLDGS